MKEVWLVTIEYRNEVTYKTDKQIREHRNLQLATRDILTFNKRNCTVMKYIIDKEYKLV